MAKAPGRLAVLSKNAVAIGGVKVTGIKWAGEYMDVTDKDSNGIIEYLSTLATQQITLSVEGIYKDPVLRDIALTPATSKLLTDLTFEFADALTAADTIAGNFVMTSYEESNPDDGPATFTAEFQSSGAWTLA
jgi:predicted secreted protein